MENRLGDSSIGMTLDLIIQCSPLKIVLVEAVISTENRVGVQNVTGLYFNCYIGVGRVVPVNSVGAWR